MSPKRCMTGPLIARWRRSKPLDLLNPLATRFSVLVAPGWLVRRAAPS